MTVCRYTAPGLPRTIPGRHSSECPDNDQCPGCQTCEESHCTVCRRVHAHGACAECVGRTRDDLHQIVDLCTTLPAEVTHRGVNGEAMMLLGPAADPEAWGNRAMSAIMGRVDSAYLSDCRDEQHPLWVTGYWAERWRIHLQHHTDLDLTLSRAVDYLLGHLHDMAPVEDPGFDEMAHAIHACRLHLEDVLHDGIREETGAPCPKCGHGALVKNYGDTPDQDRWVCRNRDCRQWWTDRDYRDRIGAIYEGVADALTASAIHRVYRVPEGTTRAWATGPNPPVRKRGRNEQGLQLYDVTDVLNRRDRDRERKEPA